MFSLAKDQSLNPEKWDHVAALLLSATTQSDSSLPVVTGATQGWPNQQVSVPLEFVTFHGICFYIFLCFCIYVIYTILSGTSFYFLKVLSNENVIVKQVSCENHRWFSDG